VRVSDARVDRVVFDMWVMCGNAVLCMLVLYKSVKCEVNVHLGESWEIVTRGHSTMRCSRGRAYSRFHEPALDRIPRGRGSGGGGGEGNDERKRVAGITLKCNDVIDCKHVLNMILGGAVHAMCEANKQTEGWTDG
jgi:hypothetical protein